ncbi:MAG: hypothetical protein H3C47_02750 [Candidatus Cloacimonetes bacterium]|nr:hypothetical protein [Candidatus Cloacimonadota bacterium]
MSSAYPLQWIFLKNQVQVYLGLTDLDYFTVFSQQGSKPEETENLPWFDSRLLGVDLSGWCDKNECWTLKSSLLEFRDSQIGFAYTPLLYQGYLLEPFLTLSLPESKEISCHALEGVFRPEDISIHLREELYCFDALGTVLLSKVELHPKQKMARLHFYSGMQVWQW